MTKAAIKSASILCVGKEWFPKTPGGLNRYVYELIHQFIAEGDRVELCAADLLDISSQNLLHLTNLASTARSLPQRLWSSRNRFQSRSLAIPDAINLHFALYSFPLLNSLPRSVPVTFTFHGPWAAEGEREGQHSLGTSAKRWLEQQVYQRCDRFIVLSKAFGTILHENYAIPWEQIHIIPGGVNTAHFHPNLSREAARAQLGWANDRTILFTPRRLVRRMGVDKLLTAMVQVKRQVPDVWLAIAGKGPLRDALEQQTKELGLTDDVKFLGYLPDELLPIAYQAADLTVVPSQSLEGFGLILLESLASGTPALCTPVGGMPEVLTPLNPHLITQSIEATAIGDRLIELLTESAYLPTRDDCYQYASNNFDWQLISQKVRSVLLSPKL
jgi:glycosyltransferase involved in cell wall biosynthesis